ncbi:MAG: hypothetical protein HDR31_01200 [Mycoplasma sp.]|nr:hypothetical protein [Mycoplasma sp.]
MEDKQRTRVTQQESETNLVDNSISKLSHFNSDEEFEKVKAYPINRTFNSFMALMVVIISIGLGVLIGCLILLFC